MKFINLPTVVRFNFFLIFFLCCSTVFVEILSITAISLLIFPVDKITSISFPLHVKSFSLDVFSNFSGIVLDILLKFSIAKFIVALSWIYNQFLNIAILYLVILKYI